MYLRDTRNSRRALCTLRVLRLLEEGGREGGREGARVRERRERGREGGR